MREAFDNNPDVKAFYCVWNETSTGTMLNYLDRIKDLTARNDSFYVVDGVSIVGGETLEMDKWGVERGDDRGAEGLCGAAGHIAHMRGGRAPKNT